MNNVRKFSCVICDKEYSSNKSLIRHQKATHEIVTCATRSLICPYEHCEVTSLYNLDALRSHCQHEHGYNNETRTITFKDLPGSL